MNPGRFVLSHILDLDHRQALDRLVERYGAETRVRHFGCRQQLICMVFAQLTWREELRDIATCLNARPTALHHLGFSQPVAKIHTRGCHLPDGRNHPQADETARHPPQKFAASERSSF